MRVTIQFETDGAAFAEDPFGELKAVLDRARAIVPDACLGEPERLRDTNGNTIGTVELD